MRTRDLLQFLKKIWNRVPVDGAGVIPLGSARSRLFQRTAARGFWRREPAWRRGFTFLAARLFWLAACPIIAFTAKPRPRSSADVLAALRGGWFLGRNPRETRMHRAIAQGDPARLCLAGTIPGDRQAGRLLHALGHPDDIHLASDKLLTAQRLEELGLPIAPTLTVVEPEQPLDLAAAPWSHAGKLLLKPRHGARASGLFTVTAPVSPDLALRIRQGASRDSLLVQPWLGPSPALQDLTPDAAAVIRAFAMRPAPGEPASVVSAMLKILPSGMDAPFGTSELLLIPITVETGVLTRGILLALPGRRWTRNPWNNVPFEGRVIGEWPQLLEMAVRAGEILPRTPVIGWDILLAPEGPVFLEANTSISLFRASLWHFEHGLESPLNAALETWCRQRRRAIRR